MPSPLSRLLRRPGSGGVPASFDARVLWMLGSPRSGSTWLLYMLADHPAVVPVNEPLIGWYLGPFLSDLPAMDARAMDLDSFTLRRVHRDKRPHFFAEEFADVWLPDLSRLLRDRFHAHAVRHPAAVPLAETIVAVKEPNGSQSADLLMRAMPGSRLLFLLRDGRDVVDSELAANLRGSWVSSSFPGATGVEGEEERLAFVAQSARKWLWRTQVVREAFAAHDGPKLLLRYEDLRADPPAGMRALLEWLGLACDEGWLTEAAERHAFERIPAERRGGDQFHRAASPGLWRENLTAAEQDVLQTELGPLLAELGYAA